MTPDQFFAKFALFADTPNAVAKMRELVLDLAIKGQLVAQDPEEEGASLLLDAIQERRHAIKVKNYGDVNSSEQPFQIPSNWLWVRLGNIALASDSGWSPQCESEPREGTNWGVLKVSAVSWGVFRPNENKALPPGMDGKSDCEVHPGDFLLSRANTADLVARSVIVRETPPHLMMSDKIVRFSLPDLVCKEFINIANLCQSSREYYSKNASGTSSSMKNVGRDVMCNLPIPLPPLAEQKRIVAKVDELMALCDQLESQQKQRETKKATLVQAALTRFTDAPTPGNLEFLFHKSYAINPAELRKTILTLAVQGKLVPQDFTEEDSRVMIARALQLREKAIQEKQLRRKQVDQEIELLRASNLPANWHVESLANLVDPENTISYGVLVPGNDVSNGVPFVRAQDLCVKDHPIRPNKAIASEIESPFARTRLVGGEILLCVVGSIGKIGTVPPSWAGANIARAVARIKPIAEIHRDYLVFVLQESSIQTYFTSATRTLAQPTLNVSLIERTPIPVPPLAEQKRIVAKVEELMALVDKLEVQLAASRDAGAKLIEAVVAELARAA